MLSPPNPLVLGPRGEKDEVLGQSLLAEGEPRANEAAEGGSPDSAGSLSLRLPGSDETGREDPVAGAWGPSCSWTPIRKGGMEVAATPQSQVPEGSGKFLDTENWGLLQEFCSCFHCKQPHTPAPTMTQDRAVNASQNELKHKIPGTTARPPPHSPPATSTFHLEWDSGCHQCPTYTAPCKPTF